MAVATDRTAWNPVGLSRPVSPDGPGRAFCFVEQTGQPLQIWFPRKWRRRLPATLEDAGESGGAQCEVPVSVTLSKDLVQEACRLTSDLSGTVETLLATYVARERSRRIEEQRAVDAAIAATNDYVARHGLPGEDYLPV